MLISKLLTNKFKETFKF